MDHIILDIPQLPVDPIRLRGITRNRPPEFNQHFIHSYLREKFAHFSARHSQINQGLRKILLLHHQHLETRQAAYGYPLDQTHYTELAGIESICFGLYQNTIELLAVIHCIGHLKKFNSYPVPLTVNELQSLLANIPHVGETLAPHLARINF